MFESTDEAREAFNEMDEGKTGSVTMDTILNNFGMRESQNQAVYRILGKSNP